jgi:hypothetical protein
VSTDELFTRLYYNATVQLGLTPEAFWLMPLGLFLDLWTCHKQFLGWEKPAREHSIDEVLPPGLL